MVLRLSMFDSLCFGVVWFHWFFIGDFGGLVCDCLLFVVLSCCLVVLLCLGVVGLICGCSVCLLYFWVGLLWCSLVLGFSLVVCFVGCEFILGYVV